MARLPAKIKPSLLFMPILLIAIVMVNSEFGSSDQEEPQRVVRAPPHLFQSFSPPERVGDEENGIHQNQNTFPPRPPPPPLPYPLHLSPQFSIERWLAAVRPFPNAPVHVVGHELFLDQLRQQQKLQAGVKTPVRKKECGFPVLTRRLFGPVLKRAPHFAANEAEMEAKIKAEDDSTALAKRNEVSETHSGGCLARRQWIDMGGDYYPRYVKSYHCTSANCDAGFGAIGECRGKHYTTKVLKRITPADSTSVEDCDQTLPEALRIDWKLISVTVTTCCECANPANQVFGLK